MLTKIGLLQLNSQLDAQQNLEKILSFAPSIKASGIEWLFLPECFYSLPRNGKPTPHPLKRDDLSSLAKRLGVFLVGGSAAIQEGDKMINRSFVVSPEGEMRGEYDKRHLFACDLSDRGGIVYKESDVYVRGTKGTLVDLTPDWKIGLSICFDLRFPELFLEYSQQGANILAIPAAFTVQTGKAHWEVLLRARAIENQAYVVACAQWGIHNEGDQETYGHSMVIDPWGEVLLDCGEGEGFFCVEIESSRVATLRKNFPLIR